MTAYTECLKTTPLSVSHGVPNSLCWTEKPNYYSAHPSTLLFGLWGWTNIFGSAEWAYRLFFLTFSTLNIFLVFRIARLVRPEGDFAWLAAALQSVFLGGLYFGTHPDFIGEVTVFFCLITAWLALKRRMTAASFAALAAGISSWPGYLTFGALWAYAWLIGKGRKRVFVFGVFAFACALATMMWLHQTLDIVAFLKMKLFNPGYVKPDNKGWLEPLHYARNIVTSLSRLLGPVLLSFGLVTLFFGEGRALFTGFRSRFRDLTAFHHALILSGGTGALYVLIGHEYVMVHVFLYLFLLPAFALLGASFVEKSIVANSSGSNSAPGPLMALTTTQKRWLTSLVVLVTALYPYGIFKTNAIHDAATSVVLAGSALAFIFYVWRPERLTANVLGTLLVAGFVGNLSQMMNYRNEADTERSFCEKARAQYLSTQKPVETNEEHSDAKELVYCKDVPVIYKAPVQ
jgi:hypothetical protein